MSATRRHDCDDAINKLKGILDLSRRDADVQAEVDRKVQQRVKALNYLSNPAGAERTRAKRDFGFTAVVAGISALVGGIVGATSVYGVMSLTSDTTIAVVEDLDAAEDALNRNSRILTRTRKLERMAREYVNRALKSLPYDYQIEATDEAVHHAQRAVDKVARVYQEAMNGHLALDMLAAAGLGVTIQRLRMRVAATRRRIAGDGAD